MEKKLKIEIDTLDNFSKKCIDCSNVLIEALDNLLNLTQDLDKCYDTKTGKDYKEFISTYLTDSKKNCKKMKEYGYSLKKASLIYGRLNEYYKSEVGNNG